MISLYWEKDVLGQNLGDFGLLQKDWIMIWPFKESDSKGDCITAVFESKFDPEAIKALCPSLRPKGTNLYFFKPEGNGLAYDWVNCSGNRLRH